MSAGEATEPKDYPREIWEKARAELAGMAPADRETRRDEIKRERIDSLERLGPVYALLGTVFGLGWMDLLWAAFAVGSAFSLGAGRRVPAAAPVARSDEEPGQDEHAAEAEAVDGDGMEADAEDAMDGEAGEDGPGEPDPDEPRRR